MSRPTYPAAAVGWLTTTVGAALAVAVAYIHVRDQGGVTAFTDPDWLGWGYRAVEVGAVLVAIVLMLRVLPRLAWLAAAAVGAGPFVGYLLTRTVGLPQDAGDKGNWGDTLGTVSLVVELALVAVAVVALARERDA